ncbi:general substrate transporter [Trichoderma barbatum]
MASRARLCVNKHANGIYSGGGAIGSLFLMWAASASGRKRSIQIGGAIRGGTVNIVMFQVGRFLAGVGIGILVTVCPMYMSELAPPEKRGWLVGHHAIFLVFGYMLSSWLGFACYFATAQRPDFAWRFPLCMQRFGPLVLLIASYWIPESPRWLLHKGRLEEAWTVTAVIKKKNYRKRIIFGFLTQWGAEFAGPLTINNYSVILYTNLGQTGYMPLLLSALWLTTAGLIYNSFGAWLHDKVNSRRWMFMLSSWGTSNKVGNATGVFFIFLYLAFQGCIIPTKLRPIGIEFSLFGQFSNALILLQIIPIEIVNVGWKYWLVIIDWCIFFIPIVYFFFPETAKLSLEEISARFGDDVAVHVTDVPEDERRELDDFLKGKDVVHLEESQKSSGGSVKF